MINFLKVHANNPALKGQPAARKQRFGARGRYAIWPVHTRFDAIEWFVSDAEHELSDMNHAEIIRQESTFAAAMHDLSDDEPEELDADRLRDDRDERRKLAAE